MASASMSRELIMLAVTRYLTNEDLRFTVLSKEIIRVPFSGDNENVTFYCQESTMVLTVVRHHKANIALNRRDAMIEFIARANYGLRCGNFDMDYRNGEMRFQVATACSYLQLSELGPQVQSMFKTAMGIYRFYSTGIQAVEDGQDAATAYKNIESKPNATPAAPAATPGGRKTPPAGSNNAGDSSGSGGGGGGGGDDRARKLLGLLMNAGPQMADIRAKLAEVLGDTNAAAAAVQSPGNDVEAQPRDARAGLLVVGTIAYKDLTIDSEALGEGGFGKVFKGSLLGLPVAIKVLKYANAGTEAVQMFEQEIQIQRQMVFPQVVQVIGVASHRDQYFLVTELCKFKSVADCLQEHKAEMTIQRRLRFLKHAAQGLAFLHDRHVIHLDVKPQNLLVDEGFNVKVGDFGLAKVMTNTFTSKVSGRSLAYCPPEIISNKPFGPPADVYAYGITAWEILTMRSPYEDVLSRVRGGRMMYLAAINNHVMSGGRPTPMPTDVPSEILDLIKACWDLEPAKRPTFEAIVNSLAKHVDD